MELGNISHPILSYFFYLRRQQVVLSALLITSQILLTCIKKFLMVFCGNILKSTKDFPFPLNFSRMKPN